MRMTAAQQLHRSCATEGVGAIAQLGERLRGTQEVGGSIPPSSTNSLPASAGDWRTLLARRPRGIVEELVEMCCTTQKSNVILAAGTIGLKGGVN